MFALFAIIMGLSIIFYNMDYMLLAISISSLVISFILYIIREYDKTIKRNKIVKDHIILLLHAIEQLDSIEYDVARQNSRLLIQELLNSVDKEELQNAISAINNYVNSIRKPVLHQPQITNISCVA